MLEQRRIIDTLFNRIYMHYANHSIEAHQGIVAPMDFVHTGESLGDWYQFLDEFGVFWSRLDYVIPSGFATVVYDQDEDQPVHVWELEEIWSRAVGDLTIPGLLPKDEE